MNWLAYFQYVLCVWCVRYVYLVTFGHESAAEEGSYDKNYWYVENNNTRTVVAQKIRQSFHHLLNQNYVTTTNVVD